MTTSPPPPPLTLPPRRKYLRPRSLIQSALLGAAYGVLTWVFQDGHGSMALFGVPATGAITMWVPLMVFAFLFGLSMDYEVFILSRVREAYDRSGSAESLHVAACSGEV